MQSTKPNTKILVDGGDPKETQRLKTLMGFVDGQTTNPSLISKNPAIQAQVASGHKLSLEEQTRDLTKRSSRQSLLWWETRVCPVGTVLRFQDRR